MQYCSALLPVGDKWRCVRSICPVECSRDSADTGVPSSPIGCFFLSNFFLSVSIHLYPFPFAVYRNWSSPARGFLYPARSLCRQYDIRTLSLPARVQSLFPSVDATSHSIWDVFSL